MAGGNDCTLHKFERNRYFYGKLMTVRDFEMEQAYLNGKRHLVNRLALGSGVVCGLKVTATFDAAGNNLNLLAAKGLALDCAGRELVVPEDARVTLNAPAAATQAYCLWLSRVDCKIEPAPAPAAGSGNACEEVCCYSRVREDFEFTVEPWTSAIPTAEAAYAGDFTTAVTGSQDDIRAVIRQHFTAATSACAECSEPCRTAVALLVREGADWSGTIRIIQNNVVHTNPALFELLRRHLTDVGNPHLTTAGQTGALVSVDGVSNPGGNVDLVAANSVTITPNNAANTITIGENHSARTDNPHSVTAAQIGALTGIGVSGGPVLVNPGGAVNLAAGDNVTLAADATSSTVTISAAGGPPPAPQPRTGRVNVSTNSDGIGALLVDSGFKTSLFCVVLGVDLGKAVAYGNDLEYAGVVLHLSAVVMEAADQAGNFLIRVNAPGLGTRGVPLRWFAIPGVGVHIPTITTPTFTRPTLTLPTETLPTFTRPTLTLPTETLPTFTRPTLTLPTETLPTFTRPTIVPPTLTLAGPTLNIGDLPGPSVIIRGTPPLRGTAKVATVKGVTTAMAAKLAAAGITDAQALAKASQAKVAAALGGKDKAKAKELISEAKKVVKG